MKLIAAALLTLAAGCEREDRRLRESGPSMQRSDGVIIGGLRPGLEPAPHSPPGRYDENAYGLSEGQKLYSAMNCVGCHANGGGGIGPPLMDARWIYGSAPENIFATIVEGRPNGMPAYRGKLADAQVWQLVAYVRSLSGLIRSDVQSSRDDHMNRRPSAGPFTGKLAPTASEVEHP
jgi:cytochrome c oxidase cbb3-type subunit 3